jgi:hypothetical protein
MFPKRERAPARPGDLPECHKQQALDVSEKTRIATKNQLRNLAALLGALDPAALVAIARAVADLHFGEVRSW